MASSNSRISLALLLLRLSVFLVFLIWTLDKLLNPGHAAAVFENFYFIGGLGNAIIYGLGILELILLIGFVIGYQKPITYGLILLLHAVSTLSAFGKYLSPFEPPNILFFAAWPMLAACFALFYLRDLDVRWTIGGGRQEAVTE
ncbi:hypothetical protein XM38_034130 [Halomicronema hongdechloris C2206]|uniref:DoxX protein n=1 Tax=Halomicronema hongdechloris C2206 TaxID=1641165 RepID=A0A1Z3HQD9_9CYAN|nr:hypothetical protein [Halomicronema hongdechloris]ASC72456.1 hypothetical protein XM38_034130 [Halomicronema hongdechloris C2206]